MSQPLPYSSPSTAITPAIPMRQEFAPPRPPRVNLTKPLIYLLLCSYFVLVVFPMFWLFYSSLKADRDIFLTPFSLPTPNSLHFENFQNAWTGAHFRDFFLNSVLVTITTVIATTFLAAMTAYALARFQFPMAKPILFYFLAGLMIP